MLIILGQNTDFKRKEYKIALKETEFEDISKCTQLFFHQRSQNTALVLLHTV